MPRPWLPARRAVPALLAIVATLLSMGSGVAQGVTTLPPAGDEVYQIRLVDGSRLFARVTSVAGDAVVLTTAGGARVEIDRSRIASWEPAVGEVRGSESWQADPNVSRLFFLPGETGAVLGAGLRFIGERLSADIGVAGAAGDGGGCCVPLLNFSYVFGGGS